MAGRLRSSLNDAKAGGHGAVSTRTREFSYIILFEDGSKLDMTLIPLNEVEAYFADSDGLVEVLLDKDTLITNEVVTNDHQYWIKKPTAREYDDCCNEFWMVSTYVVKGLARKEILFAIDHLHEVARPNLLRMMAWHIGSECGYSFSVGKNYKFIDRYLPNEEWKALLSTMLRTPIQTCGGPFLRAESFIENTRKP